ncbi:MAG: preprotein translocase subunit SecG [Longimicrobiaceae bacterium]
MYTFLLILLVLDALVLMGVVLIQSGKGDGLAAMGGGAVAGGSNIFGSRQAATLLVKASWWLGGLLLVLALILSSVSRSPSTPESILRGDPSPAPVQTTPGAGQEGAGAPTIPGLSDEPVQPSPEPPPD